MVVASRLSRSFEEEREETVLQILSEDKSGTTNPEAMQSYSDLELVSEQSGEYQKYVSRFEAQRYDRFIYSYLFGLEHNC